MTTVMFQTIAICVVLPIAIVLIIALTRMNADNKRAQIILRAIENNNQLDLDKLTESLKKPRRSAHEILNLRLLRGCIFSLIGVILMIIGLINYFTGSDFCNAPVTVPMMLGGISLAMGVSYLIVYAVTRRQIEK